VLVGRRLGEIYMKNIMFRKILIGLCTGMSIAAAGVAWAVTVPSVSELGEYKQNSYAIASATASGQDEVTFTEHFHNDPDGDELTVSYWSADGDPLAVKRLIFADSSDIPNFELIDYRRKRGQRVVRNGDTLDVSVFRTTDGGEREQIKSFSVQIEGQTIVDAGFHRHVLKYWDDLVAGKSKRVNFLRIEKGNFIPLVIKKRACDVQDGSVCFRIALNNFLLKNLVPDIKLAYHPETKRLVRYSGLGPLNKSNGKGMPVTITYDYTG